jgi:hypothetical protein
LKVEGRLDCSITDSKIFVTAALIEFSSEEELFVAIVVVELVVVGVVFPLLDGFPCVFFLLLGIVKEERQEVARCTPLIFARQSF